MKPYKVGDKVKNYERAKLCPVCSKMYDTQCRCMINHKVCPDGHGWYINRLGRIQMGTGH